MTPKLKLLEETVSTNTAAINALRDGERPPFAIAARLQHAGRGQRGRSWASPRGGVYLSIALQSSLVRPLASAGIRAAVGALLTIEALQPTLSPALTLKWPNDILLHDRKVGGVLCEASGPYLVVGVGLNSGSSPDLGAHDGLPAAGLGLDADFAGQAAQLLRECNRTLLADLPTTLRVAERRLAFRNRRVRAQTPSGPVEGCLVGLGGTGELLLETEGGQTRVHSASMLRPAGPTSTPSGCET